jgi:hypothetical protein
MLPEPDQSKSEQKAAFDAFVSAAAAPVQVQEKTPAAGRYAPGSAQDRLLNMDSSELEKTYRDARTLSVFAGGAVAFMILGILVHGMVVLGSLMAFVHFFGFPAGLPLFGLFWLPAVCIIVTFFAFRFTFAKWVIRLGSIIAGVLSVIILGLSLYCAADGQLGLLTPRNILRNSLESVDPLFLGLAIGVFIPIFSGIFCAKTFNRNLFGPDRFTYAQIRYIRWARQAGREPDRIPPSAKEPGTLENLITGAAAFGIVYIPSFILLCWLAMEKGWLTLP